MTIPSASATEPGHEEGKASGLLFPLLPPKLDQFQVLKLFNSSVGIIHSLPDEALTASNSYNADYGPQYMRLDAPKVEGKGWCWAAKDHKQDYVVVDLLAPRIVTGFAIKGDGGSEQWVTRLEVFTSVNGLSFESQGLFKGSFDQHTTKQCAFETPVLAAYLKLAPRAYYKHSAMRVDILVLPRKFL